MSIWEDLGVSGGTALIILIALYFIIKWAVKNGTIEAHNEIELMKKSKSNDEIKKD